MESPDCHRDEHQFTPEDKGRGSILEEQLATVTSEAPEAQVPPERPVRITTPVRIPFLFDCIESLEPCAGKPAHIQPAVQRRDESGYSMVEVLVSVLILTIAIVPMFTMFDSGLRASVTSSNYDRARSFANEQLEKATAISYSQVSLDSYPGGTRTSCGDGCRRYTATVPATSDLPSGSTYTVTKQFIDSAFVGKATDTGMMRLTVEVVWPQGNSFTTVAMKAR